MDTAFFWLSKLAWAVIAPDSLILLILLAGCVLLWVGAINKAKILITMATAALLLIALFPFGSWLYYPLEHRFPTNPDLPPHIDGIIMLAGPEHLVASASWEQMEFADGAERYTTFMMLARRYPDARLLFTGGPGLAFEQFKAADIAYDFFQQQGMNIERIQFERESRNTYENVLLSKEMVKPIAGESWILVTSAAHMPRSVGIFCQQGWSVIPYPVDHHGGTEFSIRPQWLLSANLNDVIWAIREWLGLVVYYVTGKTNALLPAQC
ncbi:MAG: YdcF family protein [Gammaproteobacteria bacterium]|nr:YdcF family protein [Gammaproteobacteria bacterium]